MKAARHGTGRGRMTGMLSLISAAPLHASAAVKAEYLDYLKADTVILTVFLTFIFLLLGLLIYLEQFRHKLSAAERALREREETARFVGDNLPGTLSFQLACTPEGSFAFRSLSEGFTKILRMDRERALQDAKLVFDHLYEDDISAVKEAYQRARKTLEPAGMDLRMLDIDGNPVWLHVSAVPRAEHDVIVWDGNVHDISESKKREAALTKETHNFRHLFESIDDLLLVCDMDGRLLHTNPAVERMLEYTPEELKELNLTQLYPEHCRKEIHQLINRVESEPSITCGLPLQTKSAASLPAQIKLSRGVWQNRDAIVGMAHITALYNTGNDLCGSQQMLQLIMNSIPMAVSWKNRYSEYLGCNEAFIQTCGMDDARDIIGKKPEDLFDAQLAAALAAHDRQVLATNKPMLEIPLPFRRADGTTGKHEASKIPLHSDTGEAVGVLEIWRDITEQNQSEERLKRTLEDMERFNDLMRGRERRTLELKTEINQLLTELGREKKYNTTSETV